METEFEFKGESRLAPSAARVVYDYYNKNKGLKRFSDLVDAVDKSDTASYSIEEIRNPEGWVLLSFIMDPRTGLGRYHDYKISNYQLMEELTELCRVRTLEEILDTPDVTERIERYRTDAPIFLKMIKISHLRLYRVNPIPSATSIGRTAIKRRGHFATHVKKDAPSLFS